MKKTIIILGLIGLVCICSLFLFVDNAEASITFTQSTSNGVTCSIVEKYNGTLEPVYQADLITPRTLHQRAAVSSVDANPVSFTHPLYPADFKGFYDNQFYIDVYAWTSMTIANIEINCTLFDGSIVTRTITLTGLGNYNIGASGQVIINATADKVTVLTGTSFSFCVNQSRYGFVWKYSDDSYGLENGGFFLGATTGDFYNITIRDCSILCFQTWRNAMSSVAQFQLRQKAYFRYLNVSMLVNYTQSFYILRTGSTNQPVSIDNCFFSSIGTALSGIVNLQYTPNIYINNTIFYRMQVFGSNKYLDNSVFLAFPDTGYGNTLFTGTVSQSINSKAVKTGIVFRHTGTGYVTINGFTVEDSTVLIAIGPIAANNGINFVNCISNTWTVQLLYYVYQAVVNRSYTFDAHTIDDNTQQNLSGVTAYVYNVSNTLISAFSTDANGDLAQQILRYAWTDRNSTDMENYTYEAPYTVVFNCSGYQDNTVNLSMNHQTVLVVSMIPLPTIDITENLINCGGTHDYTWNPLLYKFFMWLNYTGLGGGGSGPSFLMDNPNPANNSIANDGLLMNNNLSVQSGGMKTSVDINHVNFTENISVLITNNSENDIEGGLDTIGDWIPAQTFRLNNSAYITNVSLKLFSSTATPIDITMEIRNITDSGTPGTQVYTTDTINNIVLPIGYGNGIWTSFDVNYFFSVGNYTIVFYTDDGGIVEEIMWGWTDNIYGNGAVFISLDDGASWIDATAWYDSLFIVYGMNTSIGNVVNLTYFSNSTNGVDWVEYGTQYAVSNGTWCVLNSNFSNASTQYWWKVNASINGSQVDSQVFTFTTGTNSSVIPIGTSSMMNKNDMALLGGSFCILSLPFGMMLKRRYKKKSG